VELHYVMQSSLNIIMGIKSKRIMDNGNVARIGK
jgi:hypothetical protein